jgi:N utilization substance protein B
MKMNRRESREAAFALVFEWSFHEYPMDEMLAGAKAARDLLPDDFSRELVKRTLENHSHIDATIEAQSENWKLGRISRVSLAALRIAFCEIDYFDDIPHGATINEAVELVKKYGAEDEAAYLNGILGGYVRRKSAGEQA